MLKGEGRTTECECKYGEKNEKECKSLIICGEYTTAYENFTNTEECKCVNNAEFTNSKREECGHQGSAQKSQRVPAQNERCGRSVLY